MRLEAIKRGEGLSIKHKFMRTMMQLMVPGGIPDVVRTLMYQNEFFGHPMSSLFETLMRGESDLTIHQRELVAAATSAANDCPFCVKMHTSTASLTGESGGDAHTSDLQTLRAETDQNTLALMDFADKLARNESQMTNTDIETLGELGFSVEAIEDAIYIVFAFCLINRLANALDFEIPSDKGYRFSGNMLLKKGYMV